MSKIAESNQQKIKKVKSQNFPKKNGRLGTKFKEDILKWRSFIVLNVENSHFSRHFLLFLCYADFQMVTDLVRSKSVLWSFFAFLTKN